MSVISLRDSPKLHFRTPPLRQLETADYGTHHTVSIPVASRLTRPLPPPSSQSANSALD